MKKTIIKFIIISLSSIFLFQGCTKLLDEEAIREPVADAYYNKEAGYLELINACYTYTRTYVNFSVWPVTSYGTDLWTNASDGAYNEFNTYLPSLDARNRALYILWSGFYTGIASCNTAISRADAVTDMTTAEVNAKAGEAYVLRAWYYSILAMHFGDIPLVTEEITTVQTTATRTPVAQVFAQVISDLETAESYLPTSQDDYGRISKATAQALLARVNLWIGNYADAADYAQMVIDDYDYELQPTFAQLFDRDNEENSEIIFPIQYSTNERLNSPNDGSMDLGHTSRYDLHPGMTRALNYSRPWPRYMANRHFLDMLDSSRVHDSRYEATWREVWLANNPITLPPGMNIGDTAVVVLPYAVSDAYKASKNYVIYDIDDYFIGENSYGPLQQFINMTKFQDDKRPSINAGATTRDYIEIRLAEMYLIAAEALMMQDKKAEALPFINAIRLRAAKPGHEADMEITDENVLTIDFILKERAFELAAERQRWIDLKRTGKLFEYVELYNPDGRDNIQPYHILRPIPSDFIDRLTNKDEFPQNDGY